jgi:hypothetical protein
MATGAVKVNRVALISKLESVKGNLETTLAKLEKHKAGYDKEFDTWLQGASKHIVKVLSIRYGSTGEFEISQAYLAKKPQEKPFDPKKPNEVQVTWSLKTDIKNLSEALAILKLSEEQTVSQSLLKNLAQYLA